jgi:transcription antitermination protein NusB
MADSAARAGRHRARELAMHGLYERQLSKRPDREIAASLLADPGYGHGDDAEADSLPEVDREYFDALWRGVTGDYDAVLAELAPHVDRSVDALSPIEHAVLAIGAWELVHRLDIPYRVVINEAVELAKRFGTAESSAFVNGVLDRIATAAGRTPES